jgi:hypothetical protein
VSQGPVDWRTVAPEDWQHMPMVRWLPPGPAPRRPALTAQPTRGRAPSAAWTRSRTALERYAAGDVPIKEIVRAMAHDRAAMGIAPNPAPPKTPRYRPERDRPTPTPPVYPPDELARAARLLASRRGPLQERAWIELRSPPSGCQPAPSLECAVERAAQRARRRLREDAVRWARRGPDPEESTG